MLLGHTLILRPRAAGDKSRELRGQDCPTKRVMTRKMMRRKTVILKFLNIRNLASRTQMMRISTILHQTRMTKTMIEGTRKEAETCERRWECEKEITQEQSPNWQKWKKRKEERSKCSKTSLVCLLYFYGQKRAEIRKKSRLEYWRDC